MTNHELNIGQSIKKGLLEKGLKQKDLQEFLGKPSAAISGWINNKNVPNSKDFIKIVDFLELVPTFFPGYAKQSNPTKPNPNIELEEAEDNYTQTIAKAIKQGRKNKMLSQRELAKHLGVSHAVVSKWEKAELTPGGDSLIKLIRYLNILEEIFPECKQK